MFKQHKITLIIYGPYRSDNWTLNNMVCTYHNKVLTKNHAYIIHTFCTLKLDTVLNNTQGKLLQLQTLFLIQAVFRPI